MPCARPLWLRAPTTKPLSATAYVSFSRCFSDRLSSPSLSVPDPGPDPANDRQAQLSCRFWLAKPAAGSRTRSKLISVLARRQSGPDSVHRVLGRVHRVRTMPEIKPDPTRWNLQKRTMYSAVDRGASAACSRVIGVGLRHQ